MELANIDSETTYLAIAGTMASPARSSRSLIEENDGAHGSPTPFLPSLQADCWIWDFKTAVGLVVAALEL